MTSVEVSITIIDDDLFEPLFESFTVALSTDIPDLLLDNNATVTIEDDDCELQIYAIMPCVHYIYVWRNDNKG